VQDKVRYYCKDQSHVISWVRSLTDEAQNSEGDYLLVLRSVQSLIVLVLACVLARVEDV
jgi:hypothetical protein